MRGLAGRNVLVTGGGTGIGQAIALRFAEHGANVAINYLDDPDQRAEVVAHIAMGRAGTADEMAGVACFLASDDAA